MAKDGNITQQSYASDRVAQDQEYVDESNLFDVPLTFDPTDRYFLDSANVPMPEKDESSQIQGRERAKREWGKIPSTAKVVATLSVAFKISNMPNGYDFHMYEVDAQSDLSQVPNILQGWKMQTRVRADGRSDTFYRHTSRNCQFRSLLEVKKYILSNLNPQEPQAQVGKISEGLQGFGLEKSSKALVVAEPNRATPNSSTECTGMSQEEIDVANIVAVDLARKGK